MTPLTTWLRFIPVVLVGAPLIWLSLPNSAQSATCSQTLQSLIDAAPANATLKVPACIYRESITISRPLVLDGQSQAEIRGSDVWGTWLAEGPQWVSQNAIPPLGIDTAGSFIDQFRAQHLEQVFVDGVALVQVLSNPTTTQFSLDSTRHVVLLLKPAGHIIEVTTRKTWVASQSDNVTLTAFTFRHVATGGLEWGMGTNDHANWTLSNSTISDAHGSAVSLGGGPSHSSARVTGNTFTSNGDQAIQGYLDDHSIISGNTFSGNGFGGWDMNWSAGAIKTSSSTNQTVDSNLVYGNGGPGIWCDIGCTNSTITNNHLYDNQGPQIHFEISSGAGISGNSIWNTSTGSGGSGIFSSSSTGVEIDSNTVHNANNARGILAIDANRSDKPAASGTNINIHDNTIIQDVDNTLGLQWWDQGSGTITNPKSNNHGTNNHFWYPAAEGQGRFEWGPTIFSALTLFAQTPGGTGSTYLTADQKNASIAALTNSAPPTATPPLVPTATPTPTLSPTLAATAVATSAAIPTSTSQPLPTTQPSVTSTVSIPSPQPTVTTVPSPVATSTCFAYTQQNGQLVLVPKPASFCRK